MENKENFSSYLGMSLDKISGDHTFLAEDLLVPKVDSTDGMRLHMFTQHVPQIVVLNQPELPHWYTGYEKQVGEHSPSSLKRAPSNLELWKKIKKNSKNNVYIMVDHENFVAYLYNIPCCHNITESYGYLVRDHLEGKEEGDMVEAGSVIRSAPTLMGDDNLGYGINAKVIFTAFKGLTYEDAIVISKSSAAKFACTLVDEIEVSMNTNDVLLNLLGDKKRYKSFPDIGESISRQLLCVRRRIDSGSQLFDFSTERMNTVNYSLDDVFYGQGTVVDIEVYSNTAFDNISKYDYNEQICKYLEDNLRFYGEIRDTLQNLRNQGVTLSDDAAFWLRKAEDYLDPSIKFTTDGKNAFDNFVIKFRLQKELRLEVGDKITGRLTFRQADIKPAKLRGQR